jgi:hypothetical protein
MPEALLAAMPPILQALIEAGSGPILRRRGEAAIDFAADDAGADLDLAGVGVE